MKFVVLEKVPLRCIQVLDEGLFEGFREALCPGGMRNHDGDRRCFRGVRATAPVAIRLDVQCSVGVEGDCITGWIWRSGHLIIVVPGLLPSPVHTGDRYRLRQAAGCQDWLEYKKRRGCKKTNEMRSCRKWKVHGALFPSMVLKRAFLGCVIGRRMISLKSPISYFAKKQSLAYDMSESGSAGMFEMKHGQKANIGTTCPMVNQPLMAASWFRNCRVP